MRNALLALALVLLWAVGMVAVVTSCTQEPEHGVFTSGDGDGDGDPGNPDGGAGIGDAGDDAGGDAGADGGG